jgi:putative ABC transport system permease protein
LLGAYLGVAGLLALAPPNLPRLDEVSINLPVLIFALLLCCGVAIGIGVFTALRATADNMRKGLAEGSREQASSQSSQRVGRGIVAAQIAVTLVLVVGAGLLGRSLVKVLEVNPGFRVEQIVTMDVSLPRPDWTDWKLKGDQASFFRNLIERLRQVPGVRQVGATSDLPMTWWVSNGQFLQMTQKELPKLPSTLEELSRDFDMLFRRKEQLGEADFCVATDGYFQALGIPLVRGQMFDERDGPDSPHAALISASLAREHWPGQDPIGQTIEFGNMDGDLRLLTIVGIVGDIHEYGPEAPPPPTVYVNLFQRPEPQMTLTMLSDADTQQVTSAARQILHQMNPDLSPRFRTFSQVYSESLGSRRFNLLLIGFFAGIALLLATAGVFGVMAYSVSRRTREIGVRVALGAASRDVMAMVLVRGLRTVLIGVVIGVPGALALTRAIQSLLFGVKATDPLTFTAMILLLISAALLACYIPARRAAKVDPMVALRYE